MAVLETLFILFKLDSKGVKEGEKEVNKTIDAIEKKFINLGKSVARVFAGLFTIGALVGGVKAAHDYNDAIGQLSDTLNAGVGDLDVWTKAVQLEGGTLEDFKNTIYGLNTELISFATKGRSAVVPFFEELGIKMTDSQGKARQVLDILPELASKFEKLSKAESFGIGKKLGLDEKTIQLLQKGRREVDEVIKVQKELGLLTKEEVEFTKKFNEQLDKLKVTFRGLFAAGNTTIIPLLTIFLEKMTDFVNFLRKHGGLVEGAFIAIGTVATLWLGKIAIASITAFLPFYLIAGALAILVGLFALLYEDITAFMNGQSSLIGDLEKKWPIIGDIVRFLVWWWGQLYGVLKNVLGITLRLFTEPIKSFNWFKETILIGINKLFAAFPQLKVAISSIGDAFVAIGNIIKSVWNAIISVIETTIGVITGAVEKVSAAYGKVKSFLGLDDEQVKETVANGNNAIAQANASPFNSRSSNSIVAASKSLTRNTSVQTGNIIVETQATDADGIASSISKSLDAHLRQANNTFDDGVLA